MAQLTSTEFIKQLPTVIQDKILELYKYGTTTKYKHEILNKFKQFELYSSDESYKQVKVHPVCLAVLNNDNLAIGTNIGELSIWNVNQRKCIKILQLTGECINAVAGLDDGRLISADYIMRLWDLKTGKSINLPRVDNFPIEQLLNLGNGMVVSSAGICPTINLWDFNDNTHCTLKGHTKRINAFAVVKDDNLASCSTDNSIRLWNPNSRKCIMIIEDVDAKSLVGLSDGTLASSCNDKILIWNIEKGICIKTLEYSDPSCNVNILSLTVLKDGILVTGCDRVVRLWNSKTDECIKTIVSHEDKIIGLVVLNEGTLLSCSYDGTVVSYITNTKINLYNQTNI